jgi:hypothetical protein
MTVYALLVLELVADGSLLPDSSTGGEHKEPSLTELLGHSGATPYEAGMFTVSPLLIASPHYH